MQHSFITMAEGSNEDQDPRSEMDTDLRCAFEELLANGDDYGLFRLTRFYRDKLEEAIEEEVESISWQLKEQKLFSEQEHVKVVEKGNQVHSSKLLLTLVMEKGSSARRVMWESFLKTNLRLPKLEKVLKEIQELRTDPEDYMKIIHGFTGAPSELKDIQQKHKEALRKETEELKMNMIQAKEAVKIFQLVDRYAKLTVISSIRDWKLVEHELLARGQEHEEWREKQLQTDVDIIQTDKLFCSSFCQSEHRSGSSAAVSGVPGIGKTTMVQKIVHDWATDKIYHQFQFVFSFKFRELNDINCRVNLRELILIHYPYFGTLLKEVWKNPEQILFIFDGLDEYKFKINFADNRRNTEPKHMCTDPECWCEVSDIVYALIQRKLLPGCSVLLTSRPTALHLLESAEISIWAEILGFAHEERREYFNRFFKDQTVAAAVFKHVEENQILYTMSFNPSYCWILGQTLGPFFIKKGRNLQRIPKTITELYSYYIYNILKNHTCKLEEPRDILLRIGEMAFAGVSEKNIMFRNGDLIKYDLKPSHFLSGFVMELLEKDDSVQNVVYAFTHLTIQEFVAALARFLTADRGDIWKLLKEAHKEEDGRYELFLRFVVGLSSRSCQPLEEFLGPFPVETSHEVIDWIKREVDKRFENTGSRAAKRSLLNMFHYLFESQNLPLAQSTVGSVKMLKLGGLQMNPIDCAVLANVVGLCETINDLDLQNCSIQSDGLWWLRPGLHKCVVLRLWNNKLGDSGVKLLSAALKERTCKIQELHLGANDLTVSCTEDLASALSENRSLLVLELNNNKLGDSGMKNLSVVLRKPGCKIRKLSLKANGLSASCVEDLSSALCINQSLTALSLGSNKLGDAGVKQLPKDLWNMEELELDDNNLSDCCTKDLASTVSTYQSLRALNLSRNELGDSGMKTLSAALRKPGQNLEELRLWTVGLSASCAHDVASVLSKSCSLTLLDIGGNELGDVGMKLLCEGLRNSKIRKLQLWKNDLSDSCTDDLFDALCVVQSLQILNLKSNNFTDQSVSTFRKLIQHCRNLKRIDLSENKFSSAGQDQLLSLRRCRSGMNVIV
ncbi:NACHT, LRR and PYD domains-containing protein 3-like [Pristis pectinata]|uniref:NACHT, LRR and PYD domains-containing protein 3-like n=1 Tax=Pristis pectinata TaxID=685728 RepID=UPI00223DCFC8|nr:NACHT, LRR and PYD domains-containing protein 3-like [Pristis pectinata]XP_051890411.1 NACHT, LRR and PYD domains-containing protein 3-like [Pristis pectinata]